MVYTSIDYSYASKRKKIRNFSVFLVFIQADVAFFLCLYDVVFVSILNRNASMFISKEKRIRNVKVIKNAGANYDDVFVRSNRIYIIHTRAHTDDRTSQQDHVLLFLIFYVYVYKGKTRAFFFFKLKKTK
jgi:hypothetical protein